MRSIKELLEIVLDNKETYYSGLCLWIINLYNEDKITEDEFFKLDRYIKNNRPSPYSSFGAFIARNTLYFWPRKQRRPRIKWLKKHIKLNSK